MAQPGFKRKLSAILSADVRGYSRLMSQDEVGTIQTLNTHREVISNSVQQFQGRVVDSPGDNILAEFSSVSHALNCAVLIQKDLAERNTDVPSARKMEWRIGINLGEVLEEEGRIYGDGVNIAARIESLAQAGGICISGTVYDQVKNKLGLEYDSLGEQTVKNIPEPVRVYKVLFHPGTAAPEKAASQPAKTELSQSEKPAIAVLPFDNMSNDPEQEYFSDGMTEEIITRLSKFAGFSVIARNSTFFYKGKQIKIRQVAEELNARYVVEGSVRKAGNMVRITVQLIDATTENHLWAETYDREFSDIFTVQDEIAQQIVSALGGAGGGIHLAEQARVRRIPTDNLTAYDCYMRGYGYVLKTTKEDFAKAQEMFERAIELDPEFALAYMGLGMKYYLEHFFSDAGPQALERSLEFLKNRIISPEMYPLNWNLSVFNSLATTMFKPKSSKKVSAIPAPVKSEHPLIFIYVYLNDL